MPTRIRIYPHKKVVFALVQTNYTIQVAALEVTVEGEFAACLYGRVHPPEESGVLGFEILVEFAEVSRHMLVIGPHRSLVLKRIVPLHFLVHFETTPETMPYLTPFVPK